MSLKRYEVDEVVHFGQPRQAKFSKEANKFQFWLSSSLFSALVKLLGQNQLYTVYTE